MAELKSYIGFTYAGRHSSEFNLYRVSGGSMYEDGFAPSIADKTGEIDGNDGKIFFGSNYKQKNFSVKIAFDNLSEVNLREIRRWLNQRIPQPLIFDERPYVVYDVKMTSPPKFSFVPFGTGDGGRIYKGEGSLSFVCYNPFGHNPTGKMSLADYPIEIYNNKDEWAAGYAPAWPYMKNTKSAFFSNLGEIESPFIATFETPANPSQYTQIQHIPFGKMGRDSFDFLCKAEKKNYEINTKVGLIYEIAGEKKIVANDILVSGNILQKTPLGSFESGFTTIQFDYLYY